MTQKFFKSHSRRHPFYLTVTLATAGYAACIWRPEILPAYQTFAAFLSGVYFAMVGHHAVTKEKP